MSTNLLFAPSRPETAGGTLAAIVTSPSAAAGRVGTGGVMPGASMLDRTNYINEVDDSLRRFCVFERELCECLHGSGGTKLAQVSSGLWAAETGGSSAAPGSASAAATGSKLSSSAITGSEP